MDHVKLRYMLEPLVLCISHFGSVIKSFFYHSHLWIEFSRQKYLFAKREDLIARANQLETKFQLGSSETTREASIYLSESISHFQFDDFLLKLPSHVSPEECDSDFLCWFIGFFEAEGYFSCRFDFEKNTEPISNRQVKVQIEPGKKRVDF